jgi:hypothetical protein
VSYTYFHVIVEAELDDEIITQAVRHALPTFRSDHMGKLVILPVCPKPGLTVLELFETKGDTQVKGSPGTFGLPGSFKHEQPFLFQLAFDFSNRGTASTAAAVTDMTEDFAVARFDTQIQGARRSMPLLFGRTKTYLLEGAKEWQDPTGEAFAGRLLSRAVGEVFERPLDYLQWYVEWSDGWLGDNWRTTRFPNPLRCHAEGTSMTHCEPVSPEVVWKEYFGEA